MIGIKDRQMPDICQNCPCFNLICLDEYMDKEDQFWVKLCRATGITLGVRKALENTPSEWYETKRPEWCPLVDIRGITIEGTVLGKMPEEVVKHVTDSLACMESRSRKLY